MLLLETKRLFINTPSLNDIDHWYALHSDPEVMKYIDGKRPKRTIFTKNSHQFIGRAGAIYLNYDDTQPHIEIGYVLHKAYWGKRYATELLQALIHWGFANLNVTKLLAVTHPENKKSKHVLEKVGMHFVKRIQYHGSECDFYEILK